MTPARSGKLQRSINRRNECEAAWNWEAANAAGSGTKPISECVDIAARAVTWGLGARPGMKDHWLANSVKICFTDGVTIATNCASRKRRADSEPIR